MYGKSTSLFLSSLCLCLYLCVCQSQTTTSEFLITISLVKIDIYYSGIFPHDAPRPSTQGVSKSTTSRSTRSSRRRRTRRLHRSYCRRLSRLCQGWIQRNRPFFFKPGEAWWNARREDDSCLSDKETGLKEYVVRITSRSTLERRQVS